MPSLFYCVKIVFSYKINTVTEIKTRKMNKQGFTLIELLIVIGIIGILATVAVTSYIGATLKAERSEAYTNLESLRLLEEQFLAENNDYAPSSAGVAAIQLVLPGFQPGAGLKYAYVITQNMQITGGGNNSANPPTIAATANDCFVATATGIAGTRPGDMGDVFAIDCNNNKNF